MREVSGSKIRAAVVEELALDEATVADNLRAAASGNPLTRINVTFSANAKEVSDVGARTAALEVIAFVRDTTRTEVAYREDQIAASMRALEAFDKAAAAKENSPDATYQRWAIETQVLDYKNALEGVNDVYTYDGAVATSVRRASDVRNRNALGGAVVGCALGILLAGIREVVLGRP